MSQVYQCPPGVQDGTTPVTVNWFDPGMKATSAQTPTFGDTSAFKQDVTFGGSGNEDPQGDPGYSFTGSSGKEHYTSYEFGYSAGFPGGLYCPAAPLQGFSVESRQNSTAGHGLWLRRIGLKFQNSAGNVKFWGSTAKSSRSNNYDWNLFERNFSDSDRTSLKGYVVTGLVIEITTKGGTGNRSSVLDVGRFRLHYSLGPTNSRWVIGERMNSPFSGAYVKPKGAF